MATLSTGCIVHDRKYLSKFHGAINELRRTNEFGGAILKQLPKQCCSCHGLTGEFSFDLDHLRKICHQIQSSSLRPVESIPYVVLQFSSNLSRIQRMYTVGRFVGRRGAHLRLLERRYNLRINIVNRTTRNHSYRQIGYLEKQNKENDVDALVVLFTMENKNNDENDIEKIKKLLQNEWNNIIVHIKKKQLVRIRRSTYMQSKWMYFDGDTRWKPKRQSREYKDKQKNKPYIKQIEIPPISIPKAIIEKPQKSIDDNQSLIQYSKVIKSTYFKLIYLFWNILINLVEIVGKKNIEKGRKHRKKCRKGKHQN